jgi:hypothetical protein
VVAQALTHVAAEIRLGGDAQGAGDASGELAAQTQLGSEQAIGAALSLDRHFRALYFVL